MVAAVENNKREVGLAALEMATGRVVLHQFADKFMYISTVSKLALYRPRDVVLCDTVSEDMARAIQAFVVDPSSAKPTQEPLLQGNAPPVALVKIARKYFSDSRGAASVAELGVPESKAVASDEVARYLAFAAFAAITKYAQATHALHIPPSSLHISFAPQDGSLFMNVTTMTALELVTNARTNTSSRASRENSKPASGSQPISSLLALLNYTITKMGFRALRSNILAPPNDLDTISTRADALDVILGSDILFGTLTAGLKSISSSGSIDIDALVGSLLLAGEASPATTIGSLLALKTVLAGAAGLAATLTSEQMLAGDPLLGAIGANLADPTLVKVSSHLDTVLTPDASHVKSPAAARIQACFALSSGLDGLLDVARTIFAGTLDEIQTHVQALRDAYPRLPSLKLAWTKRSSFHLVLASADLPHGIAGLPPDFISVSTPSPKKVTMTTHALDALAARNTESELEIYLMSAKVAEGILQYVRAAAGPLYRLADSIALLDMLRSYAAYVSRVPTPLVRPDITLHGPIALPAARHPIRELVSPTPWVPNSVFSDALVAPFALVSGPNMAGKSSYLRTTALCAIMAHMGLHIPAGPGASIPLLSSIHTRIGTEDSLKHNASAFTLEMREIASILANVSDPSSPAGSALVIIDELGRGTSTADGLGLALAIAEELLVTKTHTLFVTHYPQMELLPAVDLNARALWASSSHALAQSHDDSQDARSSSSSSSSSSSYGIALAEATGSFPPSFLEKATHLTSAIRALDLAHLSSSSSSPYLQPAHAQTNRRQARYLLRSLSIAVSPSSTLSLDDKRKILSDTQDSLRTL